MERNALWARALAAAGAFLCGVVPLARAGSLPDEPASRPNFVVVLVDDMRWDALEAAGHPFLRNRNIDRLAREGVRFRNAFVTTPLCSPARASFLTGRYARGHGILTNDDPRGLSQRFVTAPALLQRDGYDTAFIGKWHMGDDDTPRPGFTRWVSFQGQGVYRDPTLNVDGKRQVAPGYLTDLLNAHAVSFVRGALAVRRPFLLYLSHKAMHEPFIAGEGYKNLYRSETFRCSPGCDDTLEGKRALTRFLPGSPNPVPWGGPTDDDIRAQMALLSSVDDGLGELRRLLEREGVLDDTVVILTSDNGFFHREHGLGDKRWPYEESIRIPFLLRYPRLARAGVVDALVLNVDLAPTLLELASLPIPEDVDGKSLVPLLASDDAGFRDAFAAEYYEEVPFVRIPTWEAIRTRRFKLIRYPDLGPEFDELYDLALDPYEIDNRVGERELESLRQELERELDRLLDRL